MFKWICLVVATVFLAVLSWLVNDLRLEIRRSTDTINEHLPEIVDKSRKTSRVVAERLPEIVEKTRKTTDTLAELAADIRQLKELAGVAGTARDQNLVAYADSVLDAVEASGGNIGLTKKVFGSGLKDVRPAKDWVVGARKEALLLTVLAKSKKELLERLAKNKFGSDWYIQVGGSEPVTLLEWLKKNHAESKDL
jgi:hypothetical protein